jgi:hypothetical protein
MLALLWTSHVLQVVAMQDIMDNLTAPKKNAKKLKKTLYIYREKGDDFFRWSQKEQWKKR